MTIIVSSTIVVVKKPVFTFSSNVPLASPTRIPCQFNLDMNLQPLDMMIEARTIFGSPIFSEIVITTCWVIWTSRNGVIFDKEV
jgi:hypothetical protein